MENSIYIITKNKDLFLINNFTFIKEIKEKTGKTLYLFYNDGELKKAYTKDIVFFTNKIFL